MGPAIAKAKVFISRLTSKVRLEGTIIVWILLYWFCVSIITQNRRQGVCPNFYRMRSHSPFTHCKQSAFESSVGWNRLQFLTILNNYLTRIFCEYHFFPFTFTASQWQFLFSFFVSPPYQGPAISKQNGVGPVMWLPSLWHSQQN